MPGATPRRLGARELFQLFRRVGHAREWKDVDKEAAECVKKVQMAGFATVVAVAAGAADGTLNAALKAAGRKQFGSEALAILAAAEAGGTGAVASHAYEPEPQQAAAEEEEEQASIGAEREGCPICLAPLPAAGSSLRVRTPCGHEFCMNCLHRLLRTAYRHSCPMCRAKLAPDFVDSLHEAEDEEERRAWLRDVRTHMRQSGTAPQEALSGPAATARGTAAPAADTVQLRVGNSHDAVGVMRSAQDDGLSVEDAAPHARRHRWTLYVRGADDAGTQPTCCLFSPFEIFSLAPSGLRKKSCVCACCSLSLSLAAFPVSDYLDRIAVEYKAESGGDSDTRDGQPATAAAAAAGAVRATLHGPRYEWACETRRPVLVTMKLHWQQWTGLGTRPTELTHLVCLSGVPWDENDNGHLIASVRSAAAAAAAEAHAGT